MKKISLFILLCICVCSFLSGCGELQLPEEAQVWANLSEYYRTELEQYDRATQSDMAAEVHLMSARLEIDSIEVLKSELNQKEKTAYFKCRVTTISSNEMVDEFFSQVDIWELTYQFHKRRWQINQQVCTETTVELLSDLTKETSDFLLNGCVRERERLFFEESPYYGVPKQYIVQSVSTDQFAKTAVAVYNSINSSTLREAAFTWTPEVGWSIDENDSTEFSQPTEVKISDKFLEQMENAILQYPSQNEAWKYNVYDCYIEITGYIGTADDVLLPEEINGLPVWKIGSSAFEKAELNSIKLPDGLLEIGMGAFLDSQIKEINLPESLCIIDSDAFNSCGSLQQITIPPNVKYISNGTFAGCYNLLEVEISEGITEIYPRAFEGCDNLSTVVFPESLKLIGTSAFRQCKSLSSVKIPGGVKEIRHGAFEECVNLSEVDIGEGVEVIEKEAFYYCKKLTNVTIPASVTSIGFDNFMSYGVFDGTDRNFELVILNPDTKIGQLFKYTRDSSGDIPIIIHGYARSTAAQYCAEQGITFELIE